jgi:Transcriptional regulator, AbiEi antitoxin, Type IV TA system/Transcriptional regulator, AbiEi antitoxin N-terminal domain
MTSNGPRFSFKSVFAKLPRGAPISAKTLYGVGFGRSHPAWLSRHGWLIRLGRDAYLLPGDRLTREGALGYLAAKIAGFHVGGAAALAWPELPPGGVLTLWSAQPARLPDWFVDPFPARLQTTAIFSDELGAGRGLLTRFGPGGEFAVSGSERAMLEYLSDVGRTVEPAAARARALSFVAMDEPLLDELLSHTVRIKVVRLAHHLAQEAGLPWLPLAERHSRRIGGARRWIARTRNGDRLELRRPRT